jgi:LysM repeat protein
MKKIRSVFLGTVALSLILVAAAGCFRPAAPDITPTPFEGAEAATPGESELEATAIANSTQAAQTLQAETAETPGAEEEEPAATSTEPAPTATTMPPTQPPTEAPTEPTPEPAMVTPTPCPVTPTEPAQPPVSGETTYVVQPGDNLFRIALRHGTSVEAIAQANNIANPSEIDVGQTLIIPAGGQPVQPAPPRPGGTTYVVQPGDNLFRIALRYNLNYRRLAAYNGIVNPSNIYVGQVLRIPPE